MKKQRTQKLQMVFLKYMVSFCVMTLVLLAATAGLFSAGIATGAILPANYAEIQIANAKFNISTVDEITPEIIPALCEYAVFTPEGTFLFGSLDSAAAANAWKVIIGKTTGVGYHYTVIERENEVCVLRYVLKATYHSPTLRKLLPNMENLMILLFIVCFILGAALHAFYYGKLLSTKMQGLQESTAKIQQQDLDFSIQPSGIYEIDNILLSLDKMKDALKVSLQQQWDLEQNRKEQISALAHDIKTPVTIIRGNAELLKETPQNEMQKEYTQYIFNNANQVEKYLKQLIDISKMQDSLSIELDWVDTAIYLHGLENQMKALAMTKNIETQMEREPVPERLFIDKELFSRAIINILDNAVEHTPDDGKIVFTVESSNETIWFQISDSGTGFTEADLKEATKQFYRSDQSRARGNHYGMGLFIAESIVRKHGGILQIENSAQYGGAKVTISLTKGHI